MTTPGPVFGMTDADAERWDEKYSQVEPRVWEIDKPQSVVVELAETGKLTGRVLDVGCGTGENAILAAQHGAEVLAMDISSVAIERATRKAHDRQVEVRFEVADALRLDRLDETFDVVIDSGLFHTFAEPDSRSLYRSSLANVVRPDGVIYLTCISDLQDGDWGPRRVGEAEIRETFARPGWEIQELRECERERRVNSPAKAWLVTIRRTAADRSSAERNERRADGDEAEGRRLRHERRRLGLENDLLELDVISRKLELAREYNLTIEELAALAGQETGEPRPAG